MLRITAGSLKGRAINLPSGNDEIRPTGSRAREAVFNILSSFSAENGINRIKDAKILDLFCGSGIMGFEALSRGCSKALFIDKQGDYLKAITKNAEKFGIENKISTFTCDCTALPPARSQFDLVFLDPPYGANLINKTLTCLHNNKWLDENALIIVESNGREAIAPPEYFNIINARHYGSEHITIINRNNGTY